MITLSRNIPLAYAGILAGAALLAGWIGRGAFNPLPEGGLIAAYGDWRVICPARSRADQACVASQDILDAKTGSATMRVTISADKTAPTIDLLVPHNVLLPKGIGLKAGDGELKTFPFRTCTDAGCLATIKPDAQLYTAVMKSKATFVSFIDLGGRPVTRQLSDKGFADAVSAMQSGEAKRHSWIRRVLL